MKTSARYRSHGFECERLAAKAGLEADRLGWLQMAVDWQVRADAVDVLERTGRRSGIM